MQQNKQTAAYLIFNFSKMKYEKISQYFFFRNKKLVWSLKHRIAKILHILTLQLLWLVVFLVFYYFTFILKVEFVNLLSPNATTTNFF